MLFRSDKKGFIPNLPRRGFPTPPPPHYHPHPLSGLSTEGLVARCPEALTFPHPPSSPSPVSSLGHSPHGPDPSSAHWAGRHSEVSVPGQTKPCSTVPASGWGSWQVRRHPPKYPPLAPLPQVPHPRFLVLSLSSRPAAQTWTAGSGVVGCVRWSYLPSRPPLPRIAPEVKIGRAHV